LKKTRPKPRRLDAIVVARGWAPSLLKAQALILSGQIHVRGTPAKHAGSLIGDPSEVEIVRPSPYVSRGGEKLAGALKSFAVPVRDKLCLDIGSSTGGFTDCLLQAGAREVIAVDVGEGQLDPKLRTDPRVDVREGVNIRYLASSDLPQAPAVITVDLSFISLEKVMGKIWELLAPGGVALVLVKPQFEAQPHEAPGGIVTDPQVRGRIVKHAAQLAKQTGFEVKGHIDSTLKGRKGNLEAFLHLAKPFA
jgi:23S rRNA (cytidine1920-2'-O)/16S rRNA (cytidine1409-2'-O)-methyltransferase